jgi:hypothetical protein
MPALLAGLLLSWPLEALRPGLSESVSILPVLLFAPLLWYLIGSSLDKRSNSDEIRKTRKGQWILLLLFIVVCTGASSVPTSDYISMGVAIWVIAAIGMTPYVLIRKCKSKAA